MSSKFEKHLLKIKSDLKLQLDLKIKIGETARNYIIKNGGSIKQNGAFVHKNLRKKVVAVVNTKRIGTLAHEMRHAWQYENKEKYGFDFTEDPPTELIPYYSSRKELNANVYAFKYCLKNLLLITALEYSLILTGSYFCVILMKIGKGCV